MITGIEHYISQLFLQKKNIAACCESFQLELSSVKITIFDLGCYEPARLLFEGIVSTFSYAGLI